MEAQLDVNRLKGIIDPQRATDMIRLDNGDRKVKPEAIYIGLCYFDASEPQSRELAVQLCDRANTRAALKLLELLGVDPASFKDELMKIVCFPSMHMLMDGMCSYIKCCWSCCGTPSSRPIITKLSRREMHCAVSAS